MQIVQIIAGLMGAEDAGAVGVAVGALGRDLYGLRQCGVTWQASAEDWWAIDPALFKQLFAELRTRHHPVLHEDKLLLPVIEPSGLLGAICCAHDQPYNDELVRSLSALAAHVSVRLVQLGTRAANEQVLERLTRRQIDVALLAARGRPNAAIATALGLSENTIKKHLKDIFDELDVKNRTELAIRLGQAPAHVQVLRLASGQ